MTSIRRFVKPVLALVMLPLALGCGDNGGEPDLTAEQLTNQGWVKFEDCQFDEALQKFDRALDKEPEYGDAHNGVGWCCVKLDSLDAAIDAFGQAISSGVASADPRAGKAVVYRDLEPVNFQLAIDWADSALVIDADYVFSHDEALDWKDLRLILAQSYYGLNQYDEAKAQVDILNPSNTLDPASDTFVEDLLAELQRLGEEI
jgi:tetratricopeptide (TPR) repeat protein